MGETHVYSIRPVAPTSRSEPSELQNLHRNSEAGLRQENNHNVNRQTLWHGCEKRITNNATDKWCKRL